MLLPFYVISSSAIAVVPAGLTVDAQGLLHTATPHKRARFGLRVLVGALSQDDVTGAVLEAPVEGTLTLKQALRLLQIEVLKPAGNPNAPGLKTAMHHQPARRERALFCQDHA